MPLEIKTIHSGFANCYLLKTGQGFVLIDSGISFVRKALEKDLASAGCQPGNLKLVLLTHGDFDHAGNSAYLQEKYGAKIALHRNEAQAVETGYMFYSRNNLPWLSRTVLSFFRLRKQNRFKADIYVEDGQDLSAYGLEATILHLPGHSTGSIGVLTSDGDLFCGDFLVSDRGGPSLGFGAPADFAASLKKLESLQIHTVYPGHGMPFSGIKISGIEVEK